MIFIAFNKFLIIYFLEQITKIKTRKKIFLKTTMPAKKKIITKINSVFAIHITCQNKNGSSIVCTIELITFDDGNFRDVMKLVIFTIFNHLPKSGE